MGERRVSRMRAPCTRQIEGEVQRMSSPPSTPHRQRQGNRRRSSGDRVPQQLSPNGPDQACGHGHDRQRSLGQRPHRAPVGEPRLESTGVRTLANLPSLVPVGRLTGEVGTHQRARHDWGSGAPLFTHKHGRLLVQLLQGIPPRVALSANDHRVVVAQSALLRSRRGRAVSADVTG